MLPGFGNWVQARQLVLRLGWLTNDKLIDIASGDVKLALWHSLLGRACIHNIANITTAEKEDVGVNSLRKIFGETNRRFKAACVKRRDRFDKCLGIRHFKDTHTPTRGAESLSSLSYFVEDSYWRLRLV